MNLLIDPDHFDADADPDQTLHFDTALDPGQGTTRLIEREKCHWQKNSRYIFRTDNSYFAS